MKGEQAKYLLKIACEQLQAYSENENAEGPSGAFHIPTALNMLEVSARESCFPVHEIRYTSEDGRAT